MAVPKYDELMKPLLEAVKDGEVYKIKDVTAVLAQQLNLSSEDLAEMLPSGRQSVFKNRVSWAKTYLKKAGLLDSTARATIVITEAGKQVIAENPKKIDSKYLERFPTFTDFASAGDLSDSDNPTPIVPKPTDLTPDDQLEDAYKQIKASLASDLLSEILKITPYTFCHRKSGIHAFHEVGMFDQNSIMEKDANLLAAELLLEDQEVLDALNQDTTFFSAAASLYVAVKTDFAGDGTMFPREIAWEEGTAGLFRC